VPGEGPAGLALAALRTYWTSAPVVVLGPAADAEAVELAEELELPLLPTEDPAALEAEIERLGVRGVVLAGEAEAPEGVDVLDPEDLPADARPAAPLQGAVVLTDGSRAARAAVQVARAAGAEVHRARRGDPRASRSLLAAYAEGRVPRSLVALGDAFGDAATLTALLRPVSTGVVLPSGSQLVFDRTRYVALYGSPLTPALGVLGEQSIADSVERARRLAKRYDALVEETVVPGFEVIATVASAGAGDDGNYSNELPLEQIRPYVEAAREAGVYVILDLQPGRTDFLTQAKRYEELLREPHVGLALDPEWRLKKNQVHLRQIGSVGIKEVNAVASWLAELVRTEALPQKMFVLHQFRGSMIRNRHRLDTSHPELAPVIHVDGQGSQPAKHGTWRTLLVDAPEGVHWGWKNFYDEDRPMATPEETVAVEPLPHLVTYQ